MQTCVFCRSAAFETSAREEPQTPTRSKSALPAAVEMLVPKAPWSAVAIATAVRSEFKAAAPQPHSTALRAFSYNAGWRIYEGGGGVKEIPLTLFGYLFCVAERAAPLSRKRGDASGATPRPWRRGASLPHGFPSELPLTHLSGLRDQDVDAQPGVS